jgi:hypothetical protein
MTQPRSHTPDNVPPEVRAFVDDIRQAHADDSAALSLRETFGEPGTEPIVEFCIEGVPVFYFRRDEFLDAMYVAGCDAMEELDRACLPLSVAKPVPPLRLLR